MTDIARLRERFESMMKAAGYGYTSQMTYADGSYRSPLWGAAWFAYQAGVESATQRADALHAALREWCVREEQYTPVAKRMRCYACEQMWHMDDVERHDSGCLAAPSQQVEHAPDGR